MAKKYKTITKVGNDKFVKYNVTNLLLFTRFLDRSFKDWRWFNVYRYTKDDTGKQLGNFTKKNKPNSAYIHDCE